MVEEENGELPMDMENYHPFMGQVQKDCEFARMLAGARSIAQRTGRTTVTSPLGGIITLRARGDSSPSRMTRAR